MDEKMCYDNIEYERESESIEKRKNLQVNIE